MVLNALNAGCSGVNSLPACPALLSGAGGNVCTQSTGSRALGMAFTACQEATGLVLICVVICMSNQNEMQTNFPAGLNLPLSCYLFGFGNSTFLQLQGWREGCGEDSWAVCPWAVRGAQRAGTRRRGRGGRAARVLCVSPGCSLPRETLGARSCDGIALVCITADTQTVLLTELFCSPCFELPLRKWCLHGRCGHLVEAGQTQSSGLSLGPASGALWRWPGCTSYLLVFAERTRAPANAPSACVVPLQNPELCRRSLGLLETASEQ